MIVDLHIHSRHSPDSLSRPADIVKRAERAGLDAIAVTDHDSIRGAIEARESSKGSKVQVIIGSEVSTNKGDITGLFLTKDIESHDAMEAISQIHAQGGLAVLPHPFRSPRLTEDVMNAVDVIETHNSREPHKNDERSVSLAARLSKPQVGGSDAHWLFEIGLCRTTVVGDDLKKAILAGKAEISVKRSFIGNEMITDAIGALRRRAFLRGPALLVWSAVRWIR